MEKLIDLAAILRSKNAGPLYYTFDVMFDSEEMFRKVMESGCITEQKIASLYEVLPEEVSIIPYEQVFSFKVTIPRHWVSGAVQEDDVYGCQQHRKLGNIMIQL
ncbi:MAG: DUF4387 domain-containing protein [Lachnospiraceae bacterium]|nr:DUF4387 domain-containing protein [Lachnospiraceae bacterium]MBR4060047.1 DUF4387 domain-containing protein [Lachnospiraceae bacterium]